MNKAHDKRVMGSSGREKIKKFKSSLAKTMEQISLLSKRLRALETIKVTFWGEEINEQRQLLLKALASGQLDIFQLQKTPRLRKNGLPKTNRFGDTIYDEVRTRIGSISGTFFFETNLPPFPSAEEKQFLKEIQEITSVLYITDDDAVRLSKSIDTLKAKLEMIDSELNAARHFLIGKNLQFVNSKLVESSLPSFVIDYENAQIQTMNKAWMPLSDLQRVAAL